MPHTRKVEVWYQDTFHNVRIDFWSARRELPHTDKAYWMFQRQAFFSDATEGQDEVDHYRMGQLIHLWVTEQDARFNALLSRHEKVRDYFARMKALGGS